jgi:hypothetical protein
MIDVNDKLSFGSFLNFGYDVSYNPSLKFHYSTPNHASDKLDYKISKDIFMSCIERSIAGSHDDIVVPISGGLDSRALLAGLLEVCSADRIKTYTFGSKSSYDFEIGLSISKKLGVSCQSFELSKYDFTEETLYETASMFDHQTTLFYHPPYHEIKEIFKSNLFLIGFMGDPLAGSHLPVIPSKTDNEVFEKFFDKNRMVRSCSLIDIPSTLMNDVLTIPDDIENVITKDEYCDFQVRQLKYVFPHVMPKGLNCKSPFIEKEWFDHMLSLPVAARSQQSYYNDFLINSFPKAFDHPCKNNFGLKLGANKSISKLWRGMHRASFLKSKTINYQDFNKRICKDIHLYKLLHMFLTDLERRNLDLNVKPTDLLKSHVNKHPFFADAIINLASLEINLSGVNR